MWRQEDSQRRPAKGHHHLGLLRGHGQIQRSLGDRECSLAPQTRATKVESAREELLAMKARIGFIATVLGSAVLSILAWTPSQDRSTQTHCIAVAISFSLKTGDSFQKPIGDLTFEMQPLKSAGWMFSLKDAKG